MSKDKNKSLIKNARKTTRKTLELNINAHLKEVISSLGHESKKTTKEINRASKQLAKKLADIVRIDKTVIDEIKQLKPENKTASEKTSDFSSPQPLPSQESKQEDSLTSSRSTSNKKPVTSNSSDEESTVQLAQKIADGSEHS